MPYYRFKESYRDVRGVVHSLIVLKVGYAPEYTPRDQKDDRSDAHIFFGLLAYQVVNTIRHRLKKKGITCYWTEIKRLMSTQKLVTTRAVNALGSNVELR